MSIPFPNYPPNIGVVSKTGGFDRTCLVVEIFTIGVVDTLRLSQLEDAIGVAVSKFVEVEKHDIIRQSRFTKPLCKALCLGVSDAG